jgi:hypothetical protein
MYDLKKHQIKHLLSNPIEISRMLFVNPLKRVYLCVYHESMKYKVRELK